MIAAALAFLIGNVSWLLPLLGGGGVLGWFVRAPLARLVGKAAGHRHWLLLLAVAAIGAALYAWGAEGRADRAQLLAWGDMICAAAGAELRPARGERGAECGAKVRELAAFRRDSAETTAQLLADNAREQATKSRADLAGATSAARAAAAAAATMENANAQVGPDDRVARDWFVALNRAAGLRAPAE